MDDEQEIINAVKFLGGFFKRHNILIGGSYTYSKILDLDWNRKDVDIFICAPRVEGWALRAFLGTRFRDVDIKDGFKGNIPYKIDRQWNRVLCSSGNIQFDLIFVDIDVDTLIRTQMGSTLSRLCYTIDYHDNPVFKIPERSMIALRYLKTKKECNINKMRCTDSYRLKIKTICKELGIEVRETVKDDKEKAIKPKLNPWDDDNQCNWRSR